MLKKQNQKVDAKEQRGREEDTDETERTPIPPHALTI